MRLVFTSPNEGLRLRCLVDRATKREYLPRAGDGLDVWEVVLVDADRKICAAHPGPCARYATWFNPHKDQVVKSVDFIGSNEGVPLLLGIALVTKQK